MKLVKSALIVLICCLSLCGCTLNINLQDGFPIGKGAKSTGENICQNIPPEPPPPTAGTPQDHKPWSEWNTNYPPYYASEIESRRVIVGYKMVVYVTQEAKDPHLRVFRNFSIAGNLSAYGARETYGEKHLTRYASIEELYASKAYSPGSFIESKYRGKQSGTDTAYCFRGDGKEYSYFIESEVYVEQYRYR